MTQTTLYSNWRENVVFDPKGPRHQELIVTDTFRAVLVGLEAGQEIAPHATSAGAYHFLEGSGWMIVDGERLAIEPGATIVVPRGASRGVEAETRLAFLGTQAVVKKKEINRTPLVAIGLMIVIMFALMSIFGLMFGGASPIAMMFSNSSGMGLGMWGVMLVPFAGLFLMLVMMFFVFRWMTSRGGPMSGVMGHGGLMSRMMGSNHEPQSLSKDANMTTVTYNIPSVSCVHCKMKIERNVSKLSGVVSVSVDVGAKEAIILFNSPATKAEIEALLEEIGYPPESQ